MTDDMGAIAEACRTFLSVYNDQSVESPDPSVFGPAVTRLLWTLDGQPGDRFVLAPDRAKRLVEVLRSAGAHPSGLGSYAAANDANALADELEAQL